ncbi:hypothetical protein ISCGN_001543 [Ixodes scapularis]
MLGAIYRQAGEAFLMACFASGSALSKLCWLSERGREIRSLLSVCFSSIQYNRRADMFSINALTTDNFVRLYIFFPKKWTTDFAVASVVTDDTVEAHFDL